MRVVTIVGAYRGSNDFETLKNIRAAEKVAAYVWSLRVVVLCPHLNSAFFSGIVPEAHFLCAYRELVKRSDAILCLPNWSESEGARDEISTAKQAGIPDFYCDFEGNSIELVKWLDTPLYKLRHVDESVPEPKKYCSLCNGYGLPLGCSACGLLRHAGRDNVLD